MLGFINIIRCVLLGKVEVHKPKKVELSYPMRKAFAELREVDRLREDAIVEFYHQAMVVDDHVTFKGEKFPIRNELEN